MKSASLASPSAKPASLESLFAVPARSAATTTVAAGAALLAISSEASGQIVYSVDQGWSSVDASDIWTTNATSVTSNVYWNLDGAGMAEVKLERRRDSSADFLLVGRGNGNTNTTFRWVGDHPSNGGGVALNLGDQVSSGRDFPIRTSDGVGLGMTFNYFGSVPTNRGLVDGVNYVGFQFNPGGTVLYGWAQITLTEATNGMVINEWAYESSGGSIQVGAVPEPAAAATGLGLLALGAAGLRRQRWLKRKAA